jgi:hypothetical protein
MSASGSVLGDTVAYRPADWNIERTERLPTHVMDDVTEPLQAELLLDVERGGALGGQFRLVLDSVQKLNVELHACAVMGGEAAQRFKLHWQEWPGAIQLRPNIFMTSVWHDFMDIFFSPTFFSTLYILMPFCLYTRNTKNNILKPTITCRIQRRAIVVRVTNGGDDEQQELLRDMAKEHQANQAGSSYRWAVAARADGSLELQLEVLPVACSILMARQEFMDDGAAVMVLKRWEITVTTFNGAHGLNGPVPRLFTE